MLDQAFGMANILALAGWAVLAISPLAPRWAQWISGLAIPVVLSVGYAGLVLAFWSKAPGGFDSLSHVMELFTMPQIALAGWVHYLAFDLFLGAWAVRKARVEGIAFVLVLPCLALTFQFGPMGFLLFNILRTGRATLVRINMGDLA